MDTIEKLLRMAAACDHNRSVGDCSIAPKEYVVLSQLLMEAANEIVRLRKRVTDLNGLTCSLD